MDRPKATTCKYCVRRRVHLRYQEKHKERLKGYWRKYREDNKSDINKRARKLAKDNPERYHDFRQKTYRKKNNIPLDHPFRKNKNGEGNIDVMGYKTITVKGHPNQMDERGRIREHIYVVSNHLNRPLMKGESVHHKNGIRDDNRIENLELWSKSQPAGQRVEDKIAWAKEFLLSYGYKIIES